MIFEDVHWIDPTSLEALGRGIDRIKAVGVLLIITHRPEFEWIGRPYVTALNINRLGGREIATLIDRVTGNRPLQAASDQTLGDHVPDLIPRSCGNLRFDWLASPARYPGCRSLMDSSAGHEDRQE
jgi:hypothetical protein